MSADDDYDFVTLVSNDGFEFKVLRSAACISGAMKRMLDPNSKKRLFFSFSLSEKEGKLNDKSCHNTKIMHLLNTEKMSRESSIQ